MFYVEHQLREKNTLRKALSLIPNGAFFSRYEKMLSRCCKFEVLSFGDYYSCLACHRPCDMILIHVEKGSFIDDNNDRIDTRSKNKTKESINKT